MSVLKTILRLLCGAVAVILMLWFIAPMMTMGVVNIGNMVGIVLCAWVLLICMAPLHHALKRVCCKHGFTRFCYRFINAVFIVFLIYGAVCTAAMTFAQLQAPPENATAVVLGAQVVGNGRPSRILNRRIEAAAQYLTDNPGAKAVLTGGKGTDEVISEADCMYNELTARGIAPERLYKEDKAIDTKQNFLFSQDIIDSNGLNPDIAIVTDGFHQLRAQLIAKKQDVPGKTGAVAADTEWIFVPTYTVREWLALPTLLLK